MRPPFVAGIVVRCRPMAASIVLLLVNGASGCTPNEIVDGVTESTYVRAMVELRKLPTGAVPDSAARARTRDSVLGSLRITAAQLESAAVTLARDPERAARVWQAIEGAAPGQAR